MGGGGETEKERNSERHVDRQTLKKTSVNRERQQRKKKKKTRRKRHTFKQMCGQRERRTEKDLQTDTETDKCGQGEPETVATASQGS